jgi:hypothetical protein
MNRSITSLAIAATLLAAVPAFAHGSHAGSNHETRELQEKVNGLNEDINKDNKALTADEKRLVALEMQAAEAKGGKAPPLSIGQRRELMELENRIGNLDKDIGRDTRRLTADGTKLKVWQEQSAR